MDSNHSDALSYEMYNASTWQHGDDDICFVFSSLSGTNFGVDVIAGPRKFSDGDGAHRIRLYTV